MNKRHFRTSSILIFISCISLKSCAQLIDETGKNVTVVGSSTISILTNTEHIESNTSCEFHNNDCNACVANSSCYYCDVNDYCHYRVENIIADGQCEMKHVRYWTCKVNFRTLVIILGSLIGIALLIILFLCCYCCCKRKGIKISKDDLKWARQREERKQIAAERRKERAERTEEIRKKYGLLVDVSGLVKDSNPYQRFDA